jgi:PAS domain S-box-containing protein
MHENLNATYEQLTATEEELRQNYDELSKSQQKLHLSEERYRNIVEDQTEFICRFTPDGKLTFVNDAYCRYFGLSKSSCLGQHHTVNIPSDDLPVMEQHLAGLTPGSPVSSIEHRVIMPDGSVRWHLWNDRAIFDTHGRIIEFQSVGKDITRRKDDEDKLRAMHEDLNTAYEQLTVTEEELRQNYDELNKSQQELHRSEERYRNIVEDQTEFICRFTPDGKLTFVNDAYCRYFGLSKSSCLGQHHTVNIPSDDLSQVRQHLNGVTPENPVSIIEHRIIMPDGEIRWQHWSDRAIFDDHNKIIEFQSVGRDITRRKEAEDNLRLMHDDLFAAYEQLTATEEELRQNYDELSKSQEDLRCSEERYRNIIEDQTEFICRFTPDGKLTFINDSYCNYFGLTRSTCLNQKHRVNIPPEDLPLLKQHLASLTRENPVGSIEHRIIMPDGSIRWQFWNDRAIFDNHGRIIEFQSVGKDITQRRRDENQLRIMHDDLHAAYEQLTATEEELRQNYDELNKSQEELQRSEERYRNIIEDQTEFICRFTPDGKLTFVNDAYCRYFGKTGSDLIGQRFKPVIPTGDIARLKSYFSSIRPDHPIDSIEHRILMTDGEIRWQHWSDRAIFDQNGKIIEYQSVGRDITEQKRVEEALSESNQKLNLLSGITRHDILNQLTGLQGYHTLLKEQINDPTHKKWLDSAEKATDVIRSQISFTQHYQDIGVQKPLWQNIGNCITGVCQEGGFSSVIIDPQVTNLEIFADPLLKTVFHNLFENAIMHGDGMSHIQVNMAVNPDSATISIEDDGAGIQQDLKTRIFEKGFGKHTGLGLFLVREVLDITGLRIQEVGIPGKGARFEIDIPVGKYKIAGQ